MNNPYRILTLVLSLTLFAGAEPASAEEPMEAIAKQASSLADFLKRPYLVAAYEKALRDHLGRDKYPCETFSAVISKLKDLQARFPKSAQRLWETTTSLPVLKVPGPDGEYSFRPVSRPLHAIWAETSGEGCPVESCSKADPMVPSRWSAALEGAQFFWVEQNDQFTGTSVWVLPVQRNGQKYGLISRVGPPLRTASEDREILYLWWELTKPYLPQDWRTMLAVVPQGSQFPVPMLRELDPKQTKPLAVAREFQPADPTAEKLAAAFPRGCFARSEPLGMDLFFGDLLQVETAVGVAGIPLSTDAKAVEEWLLSFSGLPPANAAANVDKKQLQNFRTALSFQLEKSPNPRVRARAAIALGDVLRGRAIDLPPYRGPSGRSGRPVPYTAPLTGALKDSDSNVRTAAALSLAANGASSPAISKQLGESLAPGNMGKFLMPGGDNPWAKPRDLIRRLPGESDLPPGAFNNLLNETKKMPQGPERDKALDGLADWYLKKGDEGALGTLSDFLKDNPNPDLVKLINSKECPSKELFDKLIREGKKKEAVRRLGPKLAAGGITLPSANSEVCTSREDCENAGGPQGPLELDFVEKPKLPPRAKIRTPAHGNTSAPDTISPSSPGSVPDSQGPAPVASRGNAPPTKAPRYTSCKPDRKKRTFEVGAVKDAVRFQADYGLVKKNDLNGFDPAQEGDGGAECLLMYFHSDDSGENAEYAGVLRDYDEDHPDRACYMKAEQFGLDFGGLLTVAAGFPIKIPCGLLKKKKDAGTPSTAVVIKEKDETGEGYTILTATWDDVAKAFKKVSDAVKSLAGKIDPVTAADAVAAGTTALLGNPAGALLQAGTSALRTFRLFGGNTEPATLPDDQSEEMP